MMRIDKFISKNTGFSRKEISKLIKKDQIIINKKICNTITHKINEDKDLVELNGIIVENKKRIYVFNKGKEILCSNTNENGVQTVFDYFYEEIKNLHIVGRLDKYSEGLVLLTNDGEISHKIRKPSSNIEKEYKIKLQYDLNKKMIKRLNEPIVMDKKKLKPFIINNINNNECNVILHEGKHRQIRRMFDLVENNVLELKRIRIGNLKLEELNLEKNSYKEINFNDLF